MMPISRYQWNLLVDASFANEGTAYHPQRNVVNDLYTWGLATEVPYAIGRGYGVRITDKGRDLLVPKKGPERRVVLLAQEVSDALLIKERIDQTGEVTQTLIRCRIVWGDARYTLAFSKWEELTK